LTTLLQVSRARKFIPIISPLRKLKSCLNNDNLLKHVVIRLGLFLSRSIPEIANIISKSNLFYRKTDGINHVIVSNDAHQIPIFGVMISVNRVRVCSKYLNKSGIGK